MKNSVLDSHAVIAFLQNEAGAEKLDDLFEKAAASQPLFITSVNWGEVKYQMLRRRGPEGWALAAEKLGTLPIAVVAVDRELAEAAAEIKTAKNLGYADCFAAALAKARRADLWTGDPDFKRVVDQLNIVWLR